MSTIWVQAQRHDRKVIVSEYDEQHPTANHEIYIVGYEDPRYDADGNEVTPANPAIEVGDTPGVRQRIAEGDLKIVSGPQTSAQLRAVERERQAAERAEQQRLEDERKAAEAAAKGAK